MKTTARFSLLLAIVVSSLFSIGCHKTEQGEADSGPSAKGSYTAMQVAGGGTVSGTVTFNGAIVAPDLPIEKDQEACGASHPNASSPGAGPGVAGTVVYLANITSGKPMDAIPASGNLDQKHCEFVPHIQLVRANGKMVIANSDDALHNFHLTLNGTSLLNEAQPAGVPPREVTLDHSGISTIACDVHPWMRGFVVVAEHPYYAITDASGHFSLTKVPAGTYTMKLWRDNWQIDMPKSGGVISAYKWGAEYKKEQQVTVTAGGDVKADFTLP